MKFKIKKTLAIFLLLFLASCVLAGCKKQTKQTEQTQEFDSKSVESEIQTILFGQEEMSAEAGKLADEGKIEESQAKIDKIIEKLKKAQELNKTIINNVTKDKKYYQKRDEVFDDSVDLYQKMKECISYLTDEKEKASECMQEVIEKRKALDAKGKEMLELRPK